MRKHLYEASISVDVGENCTQVVSHGFSEHSAVSAMVFKANILMPSEILPVSLKINDQQCSEQIATRLLSEMGSEGEVNPPDKLPAYFMLHEIDLIDDVTGTELEQIFYG